MWVGLLVDCFFSVVCLFSGFVCVCGFLCVFVCFNCCLGVFVLFYVLGWG